MINFFIYIFIFFSLLSSQDSIGEGLYYEELVNYIQNNYTTSTTLSYNNARDTLYKSIDNVNGNVYCVYTNYSVQLPNNVDPSTYLYENGMNCEHVWPQSMYEIISSNNMKSDMHHLRPCKENVNSYRNNKPFDESIDTQTNNWMWLEYNYSSIPSNNIEQYSENGSVIFEPREDIKGDIARSMFYFYTIYEEEADDDFFNAQKLTLFQWHNEDPVEANEVERTWNIANYQNNIPNPFILDESLIYRAYFYEEELQGDVNQDSIVNVVDIVLIINFILGNSDLNDTQLQIADINGDNTINIIDIVNLINIIIGEVYE